VSVVAAAATAAVYKRINRSIFGMDWLGMKVEQWFNGVRLVMNNSKAVYHTCFHFMEILLNPMFYERVILILILASVEGGIYFYDL
jgi:hypothetical protein